MSFVEATSRAKRVEHYLLKDNFPSTLRHWFIAYYTARIAKIHSVQGEKYLWRGFLHPFPTRSDWNFEQLASPLRSLTTVTIPLPKGEQSLVS